MDINGNSAARLGAAETTSASTRRSHEDLHIKAILERRGYVVLRDVGTTKSDLLAVAQRLGVVVGHHRSDPQGITQLSRDTNLGLGASLSSRHFGIGNREVPFHTDGSYLSGCIPTPAGDVRELHPPDLVVLQALRVDEPAGYRLVDGLALLTNLLAALEEQQFRSLFHRAASFAHDVMSATHVSMVHRTKSGRWALRYRPDILYVPEDYRTIVRAMQSAVAQVNFSDGREELLADGDVLVIDNLRMLHTKVSSASPGTRELRRVWARTMPTGRLVAPPESGLPKSITDLSALGDLSRGELALEIACGIDPSRLPPLAAVIDAEILSFAGWRHAQQ